MTARRHIDVGDGGMDLSIDTNVDVGGLVSNIDGEPFHPTCAVHCKYWTRDKAQPGHVELLEADLDQFLWTAADSVARKKQF